MAIAWWFDTGIHFKMASDMSIEYGSQANYWQRPTIRENIPLGFSHVAPTALIYGVATFLSITAFAVELFKSFSRKDITKEREKKQKQLKRTRDKLKWRTLYELQKKSTRRVISRTSTKLFTLLEPPGERTMPKLQ